MSGVFWNTRWSAKSRTTGGVEVPEGLSPQAQETFATFRSVAEMRRLGDREAVGALILSMTHQAADVLGVYDVYGASPEAAIRGGVLWRCMLSKANG